MIDAKTQFAVDYTYQWDSKYLGGLPDTHNIPRGSRWVAEWRNGAWHELKSACEAPAPSEIPFTPLVKPGQRITVRDQADHLQRVVVLGIICDNNGCKYQTSGIWRAHRLYVRDGAIINTQSPKSAEAQ